MGRLSGRAENSISYILQNSGITMETMTQHEIENDPIYILSNTFITNLFGQSASQ